MCCKWLILCKSWVLGDKYRRLSYWFCQAKKKSVYFALSMELLCPEVSWRLVVGNFHDIVRVKPIRKAQFIVYCFFSSRNQTMGWNPFWSMHRVVRQWWNSGNLTETCCIGFLAKVSFVQSWYFVQNPPRQISGKILVLIIDGPHFMYCHASMIPYGFTSKTPKILICLT